MKVQNTGITDIVMVTLIEDGDYSLRLYVDWCKCETLVEVREGGALWYHPEDWEPFM